MRAEFGVVERADEVPARVEICSVAWRLDAIDATLSHSHRPQQTGKVDAGGLQKSVKRFDSNYMLVKRDPVAYANVWWAQRIAPALGSRRKIWVLLAEGRVDTSACSKLPRNFVVNRVEIIQ